MNIVDGVLNDPDNSKDDIEFFRSGLFELKNRLRQQKEVGKGTEEMQQSKRPKRNIQDSQSKDAPKIVWGAKTSCRGPKQARMRNSLG